QWRVRTHSADSPRSPAPGNPAGRRAGRCGAGGRRLPSIPASPPPRPRRLPGPRAGPVRGTSAVRRADGARSADRSPAGARVHVARRRASTTRKAPAVPEPGGRRARPGAAGARRRTRLHRPGRARAVTGSIATAAAIAVAIAVTAVVAPCVPVSPAPRPGVGVAAALLAGAAHEQGDPAAGEEPALLGRIPDRRRLAAAAFPLVLGLAPVAAAPSAAPTAGTAAPASAVTAPTGAVAGGGHVRPAVLPAAVLPVGPVVPRVLLPGLRRVPARPPRIVRMAGVVRMVGVTGVLLMAGVVRVARHLARGARAGEGPPHRPPQLVHEQRVHQPVVGELGLAQGQGDAEHRVVAEPPGPLHRRPGGGERVPRPRPPVLLQILHRVQQVRDAAEQTARLAQR